MGGHLHPAHKQRSKPYPLHADHTALQGDPPAGVVELQTAKATAQQPPGPPALLHLAGDVAPSGDQPEPDLTRIPGTPF